MAVGIIILRYKKKDEQVLMFQDRRADAKDSGNIPFFNTTSHYSIFTQVTECLSPESNKWQ